MNVCSWLMGKLIDEKGELGYGHRLMDAQT